jgi:transposase
MKTTKGNQSRKPHAAHDEEQRARALAIYAETGSTFTAAQETGVPRRTIDAWIQRDPEIDATLEALRRAVREKTAHKYAEIASVAADELLDRLKNGDDVVDRSGKVVGKKRVGAKDLAIVSSIAAENHAKITTPLGARRSEEERLQKLAEGLLSAIEKRSGSKTPPIDAEIVSREEEKP